MFGHTSVKLRSHDAVVIGKRFAGALDADKDELFSGPLLLENSLGCGGGDGRESAVATGDHHVYIPSSAPRSR